MVREAREDYFIFLDIDGVVADCTHRLHYIQQEEKDYDNFYKEVVKDTPIQDKGFIEELEDKYGGRVVFVTGRPERTRKDTEEWLDKHYGIKKGSRTMYMRRDHDWRKSEIVKAEMVSNFCSNYPISSCLVVDDKEDNVQWMVDSIAACDSNIRVLGAWIKDGPAKEVI